MEIERGLVKTSAGYIHYRATGTGLPIILLHPSQQSSAMYFELMQVLGKKVRAIAIDYPSFGMSDHVLEQPSMSDYAKWVIEVMDKLNISKSSFLGEAVGAYLSIELAANHRDRVEKIIPVNCPFYPDKNAPKTSHEALKSGLRPEDASGFPMTRTLEFVMEKDPEHIPLHPTQSWMDRINVAQIEAGRERWQALNALDKYDLAANMGKIECPTLCMWGEYFMYAKFKEEFTKRIKNCQAIIVKDGRFSLHWERTDVVGAATLKFLNAD